MSPDLSLLFQPFVSEKLKLDNRLLMAPMTRTQSPLGIPGPDVAAYYRRRAEGEISLIITEGTSIGHPVASGDSSIPCFHGEKALDAWQHVVNEVHAAGGKIAPQLWHQGAMRTTQKALHPELSSIGPSEINPYAEDSPVRSMTQQDIDECIGAFAKAAADAKRLKFDALEIHGAHGYLPDQFMWPKLNQRDDAYGGSIEKRVRFAAETVKAVRQAVGPDYPIIYRFSQFKIANYEDKIASSPQELEKILSPLVDAGVDIFHASQRRFWDAEFEGSPMNLAGWTKKLTGKPVITVGSVGLDTDFISSFSGEDAHSGGLDQLLDRLSHEEFDLVAVGRALISDSHWAQKIHQQQERDIIPFAREDLNRLT
jgi:2,4-dienoyl-CoA reductase-like NADH-dependent reductase (Old Yellow Enzyme family)